MQLEDYFDFLAPDDIRIRGTRVGIETVLYEFIHQSQSPEAIAGRYPVLTLEQVYATITYYLHNQTTIEAYMADWLAHGERMRAEQERNPTPAMLKLRQVRDQHVAAFQAAEERTPYGVD
jgi:uncharacterized protein (DUF433 family)